MGSWKNPRMIKICPECEKGAIRLAQQGKRTTEAERVYYCPRCKAVFSHDDLKIHYPNVNSRPKMEVVVSFAGYLKVKPIAPPSEDFV